MFHKTTRSVLHVRVSNAKPKQNKTFVKNMKKNIKKKKKKNHHRTFTGDTPVRRCYGGGFC